VPSGLADAVLAVLARDRAVSDAEAAMIARLAAPQDAVAEVQLDPPHGALAPVIGFAAAGTRAVIAEVAGEAVIGAWLDAIAPSASHWGVKLGGVQQIYARGRFEAAQAKVLAGVDVSMALAVTGAASFAMLGVELDGGAITRHVGYVAVSGARGATALATARGVTGPIAALAPDQAWLHLSWDLATTHGPFKLDAGPHQLGDALALAGALGLDRDALAARLARLGLGNPSHVGLRVGAPAARGLALYFRITAS